MPIQGILAQELSSTPFGPGDRQPEARFKRTPCNGIYSPIIFGIFRLRAGDGCARNRLRGAPLKMTGAKGLVKWRRYRMFDRFWLRLAALRKSVRLKVLNSRH